MALENHQLKMPAGVSATGPVQDVADAYVKAIIAIPELLNIIAGEMQGINDSLSLIALYTERKGLSEKLLSEEDLKEPDDDGKQPAN